MMLSLCIKLKKIFCHEDVESQSLKINLNKQSSKTGLYRVIEVLRIFEFRKWHLMRAGLILPDSISEEKLKKLLKNGRPTSQAVLVQAALDPRTACTRTAWLVDLPFFNQF